MKDLKKFIHKGNSTLWKFGLIKKPVCNMFTIFAGYAGGMSPLLDVDGKPLLADLSKLNGAE
ncbi:hypothetical protein A440_0342 [Listeria monocytogenes serotype 1/2c str. 10-5025]|uniref:Uncharacterized protein n=1 Tax=Listeria monocytogenes TaxID=1639 RepID=A0AB37NFB7_LISMN|nr:hypothetical protein A440_0342 [Listeria monocytogenes serotype 1/2c str. 10-5025]ASH48877.1 hypothetical protein A441_0342 [Listeria monocytogenes serotype 1/2c str. 10-5026]ASH51796.1 hypothetical protein A442_0342 [Listeria monocytogenes serotype 3c str. 10-5027]KHK19270.1 hypothetical protein I614_00555 [Listeria monocytogenes SHL006]QUW86810.1 hypothetical protein J7304_00936 [Listeria monocytogenes]CBY53675.1 hypothetical protein LMOSLCC2372_0340 [Listeria monocytogenes SLCC2372]CBY5